MKQVKSRNWIAVAAHMRSGAGKHESDPRKKTKARRQQDRADEKEAVERVAYMTIGDLKKAIKDIDDSELVIMSSDSEGNNFSPLSDIGSGYYEAETTWAGEFSEDEGGVPAVCLWPTN